MLEWPLGWHLGDRDAPGRGDELWLLGGHHVSFMIPWMSPLFCPQLIPSLAALPWCWGQAGGDSSVAHLSLQ